MTTPAGLSAAVLTVAVAWVIGCCITPRRPPMERLTAGLLAGLGLCALPLAQPLVGASLLGHAWLLRLVLVVGLVAAAFWLRPAVWPPPRPHPSWWGIAAAGVLVSLPQLLSPNGMPVSGDIAWHEGWIRQLSGGLLDPAGLYPGVPAAYPWLYHSATAALIQTFGLGLPAGLVAVQALTLLLLALGMWLFSREVGLQPAACAWSAALAVAGSGPALLLVSPGSLLATPSPVAALGNLPPPLPRDLGLALFAQVIWLGTRAARSPGWAAATATGAVAGLIALSSPVTLAAGLGSAAALALARRRPLLALGEAAIAAACSAVWWGPLVWHAHDLGGLANTTANGLGDPPLATSVLGVGVLVLLGGAGLLLSRRRADVDSLALGVPVAVSAGAWLVAVQLSGPVAGTTAFSRGVRGLAPLSLALTAPAGLALTAAMRTRGRRTLAVAVAASAVLFSSVAVAAVALHHRFAAHESFAALSCPALRVGAGDTIAAAPAGAGPMQMSLFARTGAYLLYAERPRLRFRHAFDSIPTQQQRRAWLHAIATGGAIPAGVDVLVIGAHGRDGSCRYQHRRLRIRTP